MVKVGNLSTDGTKLGANASRHKAMSYGYMDKDIQRLEAEIDELLKQADKVDAEQDAALEVVADELPDELKRAHRSVGEDPQVQCGLEAEAQAKAEEERRRDEEQAKREAEGRQRRGKATGPRRSHPCREAANEFHGPGSEDHEAKQQGLRLFLQRSSSGGYRQSDHCVGGGDQPGQR